MIGHWLGALVPFCKAKDVSAGSLRYVLCKIYFPFFLCKRYDIFVKKFSQVKTVDSQVSLSVTL